MKKSASLFIAKFGGDDIYSYAVFSKLAPTRPIVSGCSLTEARSHKRTIASMYAERGE